MEQIRQRINQIIHENMETEALRKVSDKLDTVIHEVEQIRQKREQAAATNDQSDYDELIKEMERAQDIFAGIHAVKIVKKEGPLITAAEYQAMTAEIKDYLLSACKADKLEIIDLCEQIQVIAARNADTIKEGNSLLNTLQSKVYRYADCSIDEQGRPILTGYENQFNDTGSIADWISYAIDESALYDAMEKSAETL